MTFPAHWSPEQRAGQARVEDLARRYRDDPELRARIDSGDTADALAELDIDLPSGVDCRVVANTDDTYHLALPSDPNEAMTDEDLGSIAGGVRASTAASVSSVGSFACSTGPSSIGSAGSLTTAAPD